MRRGGVGDVAALTDMAIVGGAAGMYTFERRRHRRLRGLWRRALVDSHDHDDDGLGLLPVTNEVVRSACFSLYAFAVFGCVTAVLATYFVGRGGE